QLGFVFCALKRNTISRNQSSRHDGDQWTVARRMNDAFCDFRERSKADQDFLGQLCGLIDWQRAQSYDGRLLDSDRGSFAREPCLRVWSEGEQQSRVVSGIGRIIH